MNGKIVAVNLNPPGIIRLNGLTARFAAENARRRRYYGQSVATSSGSSPGGTSLAVICASGFTLTVTNCNGGLDMIVWGFAFGFLTRFFMLTLYPKFSEVKGRIRAPPLYSPG